MNREHFQAFLWLRWRLFINQLRRGGIANVVILGLFAVGAVALAIGMFFTFFIVGAFTLGEVDPSTLLYIWDGLVVAFLFSWMLGLLIELQRSEVLSLDKVLHLPVSLRGAFLINYVSSLFRLSLILFLPAMIAFAFGLAISRGPLMLLALPLVAAFVLMVTALTYQFQGWLASLMANPRRRRTVIVVVTAVFILVCQLPNLVNLLHPWEQKQQKEALWHRDQEWKELSDSFAAGKIDVNQYWARYAEIDKEYERQRKDMEDQALDQVASTSRLLNLCLPPGWLPLGAAAAAKREPLPALFGSMGMAVIGAFSLWRSYRTTIRLYTGHFNSGKRLPAAVAATVPKKAGKPSVALLERQLPWVSEPVSAIALSCFRSLIRAPEVKMILLTPLIMMLVFGTLFFMQAITLPSEVRPLIAFGSMSMILISLTQLVGNQFGFDRGGFRVFVLSAVPRRDILVGKNLAVAPLAVGMSAVLIGVLQVMFPLRLEHLFALVPQLISMYLLFCLLANCMSILTPMPVRSGTLKPANPKGMTLLTQMGLLLLYPLLMLPTLLPLGIELALEHWAGMRGVPLCLLLGMLECAAVIFIYRLVIAWQGDWLQARELKILETITTKAE